MTEVLLRLLRAARGSGVRISVAESLDAFRVAETVGWSDRGVLRDALSLTLAKTVEEKQLFESCFDIYFSRAPMAPSDDREENPPADGEATSLARLLLDRDQSRLAAALEAAGEAVGASGITLFTQTNLFARRMLERMGLAELEREIAELAASGDAALAARLDRELALLGEQARAFMERQLTLFAAGAARETREHALRATRLSQLDRRDIERMRILIGRLARRLATRHSRRRYRARRGQLDVRRTIRRNMGTDGVPFLTVWKRHRIDRPKVMVLCDVSGSVAAVARFLLMFLYSLTDILHGIRSFAFSSHTVEVSDILAREDIEVAIGGILRSHRLRQLGLRPLAGRLRRSGAAEARPPHHRHRPWRRPRQSRPAANRDHAGHLPTRRAGGVAESGAGIALGLGRFGHAPLHALLPPGHQLQQRGGAGAGDRRPAAAIRVMDRPPREQK